MYFSNSSRFSWAQLQKINRKLFDKIANNLKVLLENRYTTNEKINFNDDSPLFAFLAGE
jgi:hypothetical protein